MISDTGIDKMRFDFSGGREVAAFSPLLIGVVGSGNLEVLVEPDAPGACRIDVQTSARGFQPIWQAVLNDFHERHALAGLRLSINDMGATPAVVSLRLQQAVAEIGMKAE